MGFWLTWERVMPEAVVSDAHPGYMSRTWAALTDNGIDHRDSAPPPTSRHSWPNTVSMNPSSGWC